MDLSPPSDRYVIGLPDAELTRLTMADVDEVWALIERERGHLDTWQPAAEATHEEVSATVERAQRAWDTGFQYRFAIRRSGRIVGGCGFVDVFSDPLLGELGYWLARDASGFGLATESVRALVDIGFHDIGLQRVEVTTAMGNMPSRRLLERTGFTLEGVRRRCERIASGTIVDHGLYGLLREEWPARPGSD